MTHVLRNTITNKLLMIALRNQIQESLTLGRTAELLSHTVTDPSVTAPLAKAIGKKVNDPIKTHAADDLTASLLGFNNSHEMFAHYNNIRLFTHHVFEWIRYIGSRDVMSFYTEEGVKMTALDFLRTYHALPALGRSGSIDEIEIHQDNIPLSEINKYGNVINASDPLSGITFMLTDFHALDAISGTSTFWAVMKGFLEDFESGVNQENFDSGDLLDLYESETQVVTFPNKTFNSKRDVITHMCEQISEHAPKQVVNELANRIPEVLPAQGVVSKDERWSIAYNLEFEAPGVVLIDRKSKTIYPMLISYFDGDPRGDNLRQFLHSS